MAFDITLNEYRNRYATQGNNIRTDPETGIRYTTDTLGNPIVIAPDKPAGELETGEVPTYEKAAKSMEPESRKFTDPSGKEVTMTETDIRPYLFDPTLIQREADLALISGKVPGSTYEGGGDVPGTGKMKPTEPLGTQLTRGEDWKDRPGEKKTFVEPETGFTKLMPGVEPESVELPGEEKQKIQDASQRLDQAAGIVPPGGQELPEEDGHDFEKPGDRGNFKDFIIQKMGGDPNTINPQEEAMKMMPQSRVQEWYKDNWKDGMKNWYDMSVGDQEQAGAKLRSDLTSQLTQELKLKQVILAKAMTDYDAEAAAFFKALRIIRDTGAAQKKEERAVSGEKRAEAASQRAATRSENYIKNEILKLEGKRDESFKDEEKERIGVRINELKQELKGVSGSAVKKKGAKGTKKPISTEPAWATKFAGNRKIIKSKEEGEKKYVLLMEDGKQVQWGFDPEAKEWKKMTPGKAKSSPDAIAKAGADTEE